MYELEVAADFEAAHRITDYPGKCSRLHGHNWQVKLKIVGKDLDELGMLIDFKVAKQQLNDVLGKLDHQFLNELPMFTTTNPTAENIAKFIYDELTDKEIFAKGAQISAVSVWESPRSCVSYIPE